MSTKMKGFKKNRHELENPVPYTVTFESGFTCEVLATSARDAEIKTQDKQSTYGYYKGAQRT